MGSIPVKGTCQVTGLIPSGGRAGDSRPMILIIDVSISPSPFLPEINKNIFKKQTKLTGSEHGLLEVTSPSPACGEASPYRRRWARAGVLWLAAGRVGGACFRWDKWECGCGRLVSPLSPAPGRIMKAPARLPLTLPRALSFLLLMLAMLGAAEDVPTYPWWDMDTREWLTCGQCPPGTFVHRPCSRDHPTTCRRCPPHHYTQFWNYLEHCRYCNVVCGEHEEARPCSVIHNRACHCRPGFFEFAGFCLEHTPCLPGYGVVALGTPTQDTQCQPCPPGTFSANSSSSEQCQPHRNCTPVGLVLNVLGTPFHDAMCTSCTGPPTQHSRAREYR